MRKQSILLSVFVLSMIVLSPLLLAQVSTATLSGVVRDETGAVIPGVSVTAKNVGTGIVRTAVSDEEGRYRFSQISLGTYEIVASLAGFQTAVRTGITLTVGQEVIVPLVLQVGEITEKLVVTGDAPLVETASSTISGLVDSKKIRDLPLNGRDFLQLALLEPGVTSWSLMQARPSDRNVAFGRGGMQVTVAGAKANQNLFLLDGTDLQTQSDSSPGGAGGQALGVETLQEFRILTNTYSAEYGKVSGGVVLAVTRPGTNDFHGTLFHFHRNDNLDARNFFDQARPPEFKRNQFGGVLSGPIVKNRTFFLGSYEGFRERLGITNIATVPSRQARQGFIPDVGQIPINPAVRPYLDIFPLPTGPDRSDGRADFVHATSRRTTEDFITIRNDHKFSDSESFFARYTLDDSLQSEPEEIGVIEKHATARNQYVTLEETRIFSPRLLNVFRFGLNRSRLDFEDEPLIPALSDPALVFVPGAPLVGKLSTGAGSLSLDDPDLTVTNLFEWEDDLVYSRGSHSLKWGGVAKRFQHNTFEPDFPFGEFSFDSLANFLRGRPDRFNGNVRGDEGGEKDWRQSLFGFFMQDDIKLRPNLTLNLGLRYEFITSPVNLRGMANILDPYRDTETVVFIDATGKRVREGGFFKNPSLKNFAPRMGFAWDPFGDGKTAIRAGFGIYYDQIVGQVYRTGQQPPFGQVAQLRNPPFPIRDVFRELISTGAIRLRMSTVTYNPTGTPTRLRYSFNIQRQFLTDLVFQVGYVGSSAYDQIRMLEELNTAIPEVLPDGRKFFAPGLPRRNPVWENIRMRFTDGHAFYNALVMSLNKRFSDGLQFQGSYTLSKNVGDFSLEISQSGESFNAAPNLDPEDRKRDRALSNGDVRQSFVMNFGYELPLGPSKKFAGGSTGFIGRLLEGWQLGGILAFSTGSPFTPLLGFDRARQRTRSGGGGQRPDLALGRSNNPRLGRPERWFDPLAFELPPAGFLGNVGRNTLIGPGLRNFDLSLVKNVKVSGLGESGALQFRAEFFNVANHANFAMPNVSRSRVFDSAGRIRDAGRITQTTTTSRQIQFAVKFTF